MDETVTFEKMGSRTTNPGRKAQSKPKNDSFFEQVFTTSMPIQSAPTDLARWFSDYIIVCSNRCCSVPVHPVPFSLRSPSQGKARQGKARQGTVIGVSRARHARTVIGRSKTYSAFHVALTDC